MKPEEIPLGLECALPPPVRPARTRGPLARLLAAAARLLGWRTRR